MFLLRITSKRIFSRDLIISISSLSILLTLLSFFTREIGCIDDKHNEETRTIDINIGFLVGSKRSKFDHFYSSPGRHLIQVFNYGINKLNQFYGELRPTNKSELGGKKKAKLRFSSNVAETFGNESESIKKTIDLITKREVNFIVGPQETCEIESHLASIFNIPMITHYCPGSTHHKDLYDFQTNYMKNDYYYDNKLIRTKPAYWKIVERVVTLVEHLLNVNNGWYPQQLVLLYFKQNKLPPTTGTETKNNSSLGLTNRNNLITNNKTTTRLSNKENSSKKFSLPQSDFSHMSIEAIQYMIIGQLLEIKLNDLLLQFNAATKSNSHPDCTGNVQTNYNNAANKKETREFVEPGSLAVLNWHTTFHYGYTRNPFRQVIRRHLFGQQQRQKFPNQSYLNSERRNQCSDNKQHQQVVSPMTTKTTASSASNDSGRTNTSRRRSPTSSLYIIVGHYYEHLGLMLALNELNLFGNNNNNDNSNVHQTEQQQQQQSQSPNASQGAGSYPNVSSNPSLSTKFDRSIVIGVDIEQYDERDDSIRFLRGLLMNNESPSQTQNDVNNNNNDPILISNARQQINDAAGFASIDSISEMYRNYMGVVPTKPSKVEEFLEDMKLFLSNNQPKTNGANNFNLISAINQSSNTLISNQLYSQRLFQFIRLPIESFYLQESLMLIGEYFDDCLLEKSKTLLECSDAQVAFNWFKNREYLSLVTNEMVKLDSNAQAEGSYTIISKRLINSNQAPVDSISATAPTVAVSSQTQLSSSNEYVEFGLEPVGYFVDNSEEEDNKIKLLVDSKELDTIWLPFWCYLQRLKATNFNASNSYCEQILFGNVEAEIEVKYQQNDTDNVISNINLWQRIIILIIIIVFVVLVVIFVKNEKVKGLSLYSMGTTKTNQCVGLNVGWFNEIDVKNFLYIVNNLLFMQETIVKSNDADDDDDDDNTLTNYFTDTFLLPNDDNSNAHDDHFREKNDEENSSLDTNNNCSNRLNDLSKNHKIIEVELHCHMFPFPSCIFVHWITALHQLKESMFQYQSATISNNNTNNDGNNKRLFWNRTQNKKEMSSKSGEFSLIPNGIRKDLNSNKREERQSFSQNNNQAAGSYGGFFSTKHKGTASLRILMHKYKSINGCLFKLSQLNNENITKLIGIRFGYNFSNFQNNPNKIDRKSLLLLEGTERGNLREVYVELIQNLTPISGDLDDNNDDNYLIMVENLKLSIISRFIQDILNGLSYLHKCSPGIDYHGDLRASTCLITTNLRLKLSGFHERHMRNSLGTYELKGFSASALDANVNANNNNDSLCLDDNLIYCAPEVLESYTKVNSLNSFSMKLADFYSFAFIIYELLNEHEPWSCLTNIKSTKLFIERIKVDASFRPPLSRLDKKSTTSKTSSVCSISRKTSPFINTSLNIPKATSNIKTERIDLEGVQELLRSCWSQVPSKRPQNVDILKDRIHIYLVKKLKSSYHEGRKIFENYTNLLEIVSLNLKENLILKEKETLHLEYKLLPEMIRNKLINFKVVKNKSFNDNDIKLYQTYECVCFCFFRFIFYDNLENNYAYQIEQLDKILIQLNELTKTYKNHIQLVDSQLDSHLRYMAYTVNDFNSNNINGTDRFNSTSTSTQTSLEQFQLIASFALQLIDLVNNWQQQQQQQANDNTLKIQIRCSLHYGQTFGGLLWPPVEFVRKKTSSLKKDVSLDLEKPLTRYVLMGKAMEVCSILETTSLPQRIQISADFRDKLLQSANFCSSSSSFGFLSAKQTSTILISNDSSAYDNLDFRLEKQQRKQSYVIIKREGKIQVKNMGDLEAYWLLNGPRLLKSQSLMFD